MTYLDNSFVAEKKVKINKSFDKTEEVLHVISQTIKKPKSNINSLNGSTMNLQKTIKPLNLFQIETLKEETQSGDVTNSKREQNLSLPKQTKHINSKFLNNF